MALRIPLKSESAQRWLNFRLLLGRTPFKGSPKSDHMIELLRQKGLRLTPSEISSIYWEQSEITDAMARRVETAFDLTAGWLDANHEYAFRTRADDRADIEAILSLPSDIRMAIRTLMRQLLVVRSSEVSANE
jgi:plasmid maintenance system antidote protein VapI